MKTSNTPSAPLTHEEVEKKKENALIEWIEELIIESLYCMGCEWCAERSEYCDSCEWKIAYCRSLRTRAEQAEAQLKTRTEDAEGCRAEMLQFIQLAATGKRRDGTYNYCREALEQKAKAILSRLYPPKP